MMNERNTYVISDNEMELVRLQLQGSIFDEMLPPFPHLFQHEQHPDARLLDLGCGPGTWVMQIAHAYPDFEVVGIDVNPRMITYAQAQAEVQELDIQFRVMDALQTLDFPDGSFDFVNLRLGTSFMRRSKAPDVFQECWRVLKPGGVFRDTETVAVTVSHPAYRQMLAWIAQAFAASGLTDDASMATSASTSRMLQDIGFQSIDLVSHVFDMSAGRLLHQAMTEDNAVSLPQLKPFVVEKMHICDSAEFDRTTEASLQEWQNPAFCAHWYMCAVCGMKPG